MFTDFFFVSSHSGVCSELKFVRGIGVGVGNAHLYIKVMGSSRIHFISSEIAKGSDQLWGTLFTVGESEDQGKIQHVIGYHDTELQF